MRVNINGVDRDMTPEEIAEYIASLEGAGQDVAITGTSRINQIIEVVGYDHVKMFLPFSEMNGIYKSVVNPEISFSSSLSANNYAHINGGPLGHYIQKGAADDVLLQNPVLNSPTGSSTPEYAAKYATKIRHLDGLISMVKVDLSKIGTFTGSYKIRLYSESSGKPGSLIPTREMQIGTRVDPIQTYVGHNGQSVAIMLLDDFPLSEGASYWLVFEYEDASQVDASKYFAWKYGTDADGSRAVWSGSEWVVTAGESFNYKLYNDKLTLPEDWTFISLIKRPKANAQNTLFGITDPSKNYCLQIAEYYGKLYVFYQDAYGYATYTNRMANMTDWCTLAVSFGKYDNQDKVLLYHNGNPLDTRFEKLNSVNYSKTRDSMFGATTSLMRGGQYFIGRSMLPTCQGWSSSWGIIGPTLMAGRKMSRQEIAKVTALMLKGDN